MPETLKGFIERVTYHNPENGFAVLNHAARFTSVHFFQSLPDDRTFTSQDDGLRHLAKLPKINDVALSDTAVSDAGLVHLGRLKNLKTISLKNTKVTDAGVAQLQ